MKSRFLNKLSYIKLEWTRLNKKNQQKRRKKCKKYWINNYIPKPIKKIPSDFKGDILNLYN